MKRSVNFNGFQPKHRTKYNTLADFVATCLAVGMTDEEIRQVIADEAAGRVPEPPKRDIDHYHRFYCPKEDCFTVTTEQLADADGWIACEVCGGVCEEIANLPQPPKER